MHFFYKDKENLSRQTLNVGLTGLFEGKNVLKDSLKVTSLLSVKYTRPLVVPFIILCFRLMLGALVWTHT